MAPYVLESFVKPVVFCPPDSEFAPVLDFVDTVRLDSALPQPEGPMESAEIHQGTADVFWRLLVSKIKERESKYLQFLDKNRESEDSFSELRARFDAEHPMILAGLADLWNRILDRAGLKFDFEKASIPVQLTDTFSAYISLKNDNTNLPWSELSTGIRHFLFRLGHIYTSRFGRSNEGGILLVDEPEASLHPDFLYDLVANYQEVAPGMQLFMATHSPIIAAQFRPEERFVLEFQDDGSVTAHKGISPEGDDPNDVLKRDFKVRSLYGAKGIEMWERFLKLGRQIKREPDAQKREPLMEEYLQIGRSYDFSPDSRDALPN